MEKMIVLAIAVFAFAVLSRHLYLLNEEVKAEVAKEEKAILNLKAEAEKQDFLIAAMLSITAYDEGDIGGCKDNKCLAEKIYAEAVQDPSNKMVFDDYYAAYGDEQPW